MWVVGGFLKARMLTQGGSHHFRVTDCEYVVGTPSRRPAAISRVIATSLLAILMALPRVFSGPLRLGELSDYGQTR